MHDIDQIEINGDIGADIVRRARLAVAVHLGMVAGLAEDVTGGLTAPAKTDWTGPTVPARRIPGPRRPAGEVRA